MQKHYRAKYLVNHNGKHFIWTHLVHSRIIKHVTSCWFYFDHTRCFCCFFPVLELKYSWISISSSSPKVSFSTIHYCFNFIEVSGFFLIFPQYPDLFMQQIFHCIRFLNVSQECEKNVFLIGVYQSVHRGVYALWECFDSRHCDLLHYS